jgi:hypothetical protein
MTGISGWQAIEVFRRHPSDRLLIALHDGELPEGKRVRALLHLERCTSCRLRSSQIGLDWCRLLELNSSDLAGLNITGQEIAARVQSVIHDWSKEHPVRTEAARRIENVLGVYLGKRAAAALLQERGASQDPVQDALASAGSTLRILLGNKSAAAIEAKLLQITGRTPESAGGSST